MFGPRGASVYARLPVFLQNTACSVYGWKEARVRFGGEFERRITELTESEWWTRGQITDYQDEALKRLIRHAYQTVPFYREVMRAEGLKPADIVTRDDLPKLPRVSKDDVRRAGASVISSAADRRRLIHRHTSGTTGTSLDFFSTRSAIAFQWAVWWRHRMRFGLEFGDWHVNFTGQLVVPPDQQLPPFWRWNGPFRQAILTMHHLTSSKISSIVDFLNRHQFRLYSGYPSIIHAFSLAAMEANLVLERSPLLVSTGAENMLRVQRRDIGAFTGAVLTDTYGLSEGCGNASHCPQFRYHEDFEFGILECVDPIQLDERRVRGSIVCTGFANSGMPFIRYDTGDIGVWDVSGRPCPCGRESKVLVEIEGRIDDYVMTPEGRRIMRFDYLFKDANNVKEVQVVQSQLGAIVLRVVRRPAYGEADERFIRDQVCSWISPELKVSFEYVNEIERGPNGKFKAVRSLLRSRGAGAPSL